MKLSHFHVERNSLYSSLSCRIEILEQTRTGSHVWVFQNILGRHTFRVFSYGDRGLPKKCSSLSHDKGYFVYVATQIIKQKIVLIDSFLK